MTTTRKRAAITTLGCKLNQYDSERIREQLQRRGYDIVPYDEPADLYVVNSCTVTSKSDRDARRLARQAKRRSPDSLVVVTGCYAEVSPEELAAIAEIDVVLSNTEKDAIAAHVPPGCEATRGDDHPGDSLIDSFADHTRAFVKVQEGCDAHCAYCIVPLARGPSRSMRPVEVVRQVEKLIAAGHPEIVLIGVHLGMYGRDLEDEHVDLEDLARWLCEVAGLGRLRFSSTEPCEVTPGIVDLIARHPKVCRHLHLPLQSGSDAILRSMGRPYTTAVYADLVHRIREASGLACLGADVMVGFPGETDREFEETVAYLERLPLSYLHVFAYSPRPGTAAASMPNQVAPETKRRRSRILMKLSVEKRAEFARRNVGEELEVVPEQPLADDEGYAIGVSDNYLRVRFPESAATRGQIVRVKALSAEAHFLNGEVTGHGAWATGGR